MKRLLVAIVFVLFAAAIGNAVTATSAQTNELRMNGIQVLGTHNSYHQEPYPELLQIIKQFQPEQGLTFEYSHAPLSDQFGRLGIRQVELDVFADPGPTPLFASPLGESVVKGPSSVPIAGMLAPGLKVLHIQDIDYRSTCLTFVACLQEIQAWSSANPGHLPVLVLIEAKDDPLELPAGIPPAAVPVPIGSAELQSIDNAIRSVFLPAQLITPDNVRGSRPTLEQAVLQDGWPTLDTARGRVLFALDNQDAKRDAYIAGHPSLQGRVMFTSSEPGTPEAAFVKLNDPIADQQRIKTLVGLGYLVRTRADADTAEARSGDVTRRDAAFASGAQFVSTDYPEPDPDLTAYTVTVPGGKLGRCNPVLNVPACTATVFDPPATPTPAPTATPTATVPSPATATPTATAPATTTPSPTATAPATATPSPTAPAPPTATIVAPRPPTTGDGPPREGGSVNTSAALIIAGLVLLALGSLAGSRRSRG